MAAVCKRLNTAPFPARRRAHLVIGHVTVYPEQADGWDWAQ